MFRQDLDIAKARLDIQIFPSFYLKLKNDRYEHGTEIDAILAFHDDRHLRKLLGRMTHRKYIDLKTEQGTYRGLFTS